MGGKRLTAEGKEPTGKEIRIPTVAAIKSFAVAATENTDSKVELAETFQVAKDEATKKHVELKPFNHAKQLHDDVVNAKNQSIAAEKLARWLSHFDHYRKHFKLDELANLQGRMFKEGPIGGNPEEPGREIQEDGQPDDRPRHLRQPDASAESGTEAVRSMAAQAGAKMSDGTNPIDQVGRGDTPDTKH